MKNAIVILTRLYIDKDKLEDRPNDEFRAVQCPDSENYKLIKTLDVDVLILHGHDKRFNSDNPFSEFSAEVSQLLGTQKAYLFYHLGNETIIHELVEVSKANFESPFLDSISYTIGGGGDARLRGNKIAALYMAINANNSHKANECVRDLLKSFQHDTNTQSIYDYVNALINLSYRNNLDDVVEMLSSDYRIASIQIDEEPILDYIRKNRNDSEIMKKVAIYLKQQLQTK